MTKSGDDLGAYIKWLSVFTYWVVTYGVGCGLLTFLPDEYIPDFVNAYPKTPQ